MQGTGTVRPSNRRQRCARAEHAEGSCDVDEVDAEKAPEREAEHPAKVRVPPRRARRRSRSSHVPTGGGRRIGGR